MNKNQLIIKYFDRSSLLTTRNEKYRQQLVSLFKWLTEADGVKNDVTTSCLHLRKEATAKIICRDNHAVLSGIEELQFLLAKFTKLDFISLKRDKDVISKNQTVSEIKGKASEILAYERTILNILQRMSGIATQTYHFIKITNATYSSDRLNMCPLIASTRKTPWMWIDKKAVSIGGGLTHRLNLSDGILIKDNHLKLISKAMKTLKESAKLIEIEVESYKQAVKVIKTFRPNALMLDNFTPVRAKKTVAILKNEFDLSSIIIEASGGIDGKNITDWIKTGVDIISLGSLTHSARASNFSLEI